METFHSPLPVLALPPPFFPPTTIATHVAWHTGRCCQERKDVWRTQGGHPSLWMTSVSMSDPAHTLVFQLLGFSISDNLVSHSVLATHSHHHSPDLVSTQYSSTSEMTNSDVLLSSLFLHPITWPTPVHGLLYSLPVWQLPFFLHLPLSWLRWYGSECY